MLGRCAATSRSASGCLRRRRTANHEPPPAWATGCFGVSDRKTLAFARHGCPAWGCLLCACVEENRAGSLTGRVTGLRGMNRLGVKSSARRRPRGRRRPRATSPGRSRPSPVKPGTPVCIPAGANRPARLAYQRKSSISGFALSIWQRSPMEASSVSLAGCARSETAAVFSPDATRVAFSSDRSGTKESGLQHDGGDLIQVTSRAVYHCAPGWSRTAECF